jgi:hypothetical protein
MKKATRTVSPYSVMWGRIKNIFVRYRRAHAHVAHNCRHHARGKVVWRLVASTAIRGEIFCTLRQQIGSFSGLETAPEFSSLTLKVPSHHQRCGAR